MYKKEFVNCFIIKDDIYKLNLENHAEKKHFSVLIY